MFKSVKNLRALNQGKCFVVNPDGFIQIQDYNEKDPGVGAVLMTKTPRVRMLGTRLGDEKSNSYKDIKAEFSWHVFPRWAFYYDAKERKIAVGDQEYIIFSEESPTQDFVREYSGLIFENGDGMYV